jgi:hypothetical protein
MGVVSLSRLEGLKFSTHVIWDTRRSITSAASRTGRDYGFNDDADGGVEFNHLTSNGKLGNPKFPIGNFGNFHILSLILMMKRSVI